MLIIIIATFLGNLALIIPANSVPAMAMPAPTPAVVSRSIETFDANVRTAIDTNNSTKDPNKTRLLSNRRASRGVGSANNPISRVEMVVSNDATACESENCRLMSGNTGPI